MIGILTASIFLIGLVSPVSSIDAAQSPVTAVVVSDINRDAAAALTSVEQLSTALIDAATDDERAQMIAAHQHLVSAELVTQLMGAGKRFQTEEDSARARVAFLLTSQLAERLGDTARTAKALNELGVGYGTEANYGKALEYFQRSLRLVEQLGDENRALDLLINIGNVFRWQRDFEQALSVQRRVLAAAEKSHDARRTAIPTINIAFILEEQGDLAGAQRHFERGLAIMRDLKEEATVAYTLVSLARILAKRGCESEAIAAYGEARQIQEKSGNKGAAAYTLLSLASIDAGARRWREAIAAATRGLALAEEVGARESIWRAQSLLGKAYLSVGEVAPARAAYEGAIRTIEGMRQDLVGGEREQQRFFADKLEPYWGMVAVSLDASRPEDALAHAERAKSRMLLDVAVSGRSRITQAMTAAERDREVQLRAAVAAANAEYRRVAGGAARQPARVKDVSDRRDRALLDYERFETALYATHPELKVKRGQAEWAGLAATARLIPEDGAIVEFSVADERTYGFVVTRGATGAPEVRAWTIAVSATDLAARAGALRRSLESRDLGFRRAAREMYDLLLAPAASQLAGKSTLIVVPDRVLWEVPFQALDAGGRYVLDDHIVLYSTSIAVLDAMSRASGDEGRTPRVLAVGNAALPNSLREVHALGRIYGDGNATVWTGAEASEARIKESAAAYSILHFATHGIRDNQNPMRSHLVLTRPGAADKEDGVLEAWELMQMDLHADLLVLSACETALGQVDDGEGMIGLAWALFIAGTPTVVASQWRVDSASTTDLVIGLHRELAAPPVKLSSSLRTARALRASALRLLHSGAYTHPFYWAGFVVIGDRL